MLAHAPDLHDNASWGIYDNVYKDVQCPHFSGAPGACKAVYVYQALFSLHRAWERGYHCSIVEPALLSTADTLGTAKSDLISEVSTF